MHELSIARGIADIVCEHVPPPDRGRIRAITVDVGDVSGIVPDSLSFCFEAVSTECGLPSETLVLRRIPFRCYCRPCGEEFGNDNGIVVCPRCGGVETDVRSGRELRVVTIDIVETSKE